MAIGCAASHWDEACGGPRPALAECALGVYSADCGGDGEPLFACAPESGTCRWFRGACVAEGFVVSDCRASDRCCHATPGGTWPFADGMVGERSAPGSIVEDIAVIGSTPITDEGPLNLTVSIDPTIDVPAFITVTCVGETALLRADGTPTGRLLLTSQSDDRTRPPVPNCAFPPGLGVAPSGTLVVSALAAGSHGRLEIPLPDGSFTVTF